MNMAYWLNLKNNLLFLAEDDEEYNAFMETASSFHYQVGLISDRFPLISTLSVLENITLMYMYHQNFTRKRATTLIMPYVEALGMNDILDKHNEDLTREDTIKTCLLRCVAKNNLILLLNTPRITDIELVMDCLANLNRTLRFWILCLENNAQTYAQFALRTIAIGG